jgi:hypothetical protein
MKLLKGINYLFITITIVLIIIFCANLFGNPLYRNDGRFFTSIAHLISIPLLAIFSIIISIKTHQQKGVMLFALFLAILSMNWIIQYLHLLNPDWIPSFGLLIINALTGTIYLKAFQSFPRQISKQDIIAVFPKNKIVSGYINWAIKDYTWLLFPILLLGGALLHINDKLSDIFVLLTGLLCLYVNYKRSSATERNKILWLFWGLISFTFLMIMYSILDASITEISRFVKLLYNCFLIFAFLLSLVMSLFFSNTFDTGILIRRTLVDGLIFIVIVLVYNTIEHYFLHWLSDELEISDVILSSLLSGIFVLAFSPLHHKFMSYLEKKVKKNHVEHNEIQM